MRLRASIAIVTVACAISAAGVHAQEPPADAAPGESRNPAEAGSSAAGQSRLDRLFDRLAGAETAGEARRLEASIEAIWSRSGSATADLLVDRASQAVQQKDADAALTLLNMVVELAPDFADGYNKRATVFFLSGDYARAMLDIRRALSREPRHYGAWAGLGRILEETGDERAALDAYRRALALDPHIEGLKANIDRIAGKLRGRDA